MSSKSLQRPTRTALAGVQAPSTARASGAQNGIGNAAMLERLGLSTGAGTTSATGSAAPSMASMAPTAAGSVGGASPEEGLLDGAIDWLIGDDRGAAWGDIWDCATGDQKWASGPTGGFMPQSLADDMETVRGMVPANAADNGMHAWHAGTNAMLAQKLGVVGAPLILLGGLYHESPLDWESFQAEQDYQGTVNHVIDSTMDIASNVTGMGIGYLDGSDDAVQHAVDVGNQIPGPGDPDPAFGGGGAYDGDPTKAW